MWPFKSPEAKHIARLKLEALQGSADSQCILGLAYVTGYGVPKDEAESAKWYRKAAEQGNAEGQKNLGKYYVTGYGVPQDPVQAHAWLNLATSSEGYVLPKS